MVAQALFSFANDVKQRKTWLTVLHELIDENPTRPEAYYVLINHYLTVAEDMPNPGTEYAAALAVATKLFSNVKSFHSFSEK